jgi:hypothetical protein
VSTWPASLPQDPSVVGYTEQPADRVLRSSVGYGLNNLRWKDAPEVVFVTLQMILTKAQAQTLLTFYTDTVKATGDVDWKDHLSTSSPQDPVVYKFAEPPTFSFVEAGNWQVTMTLEKR